MAASGIGRRQLVVTAGSVNACCGSLTAAIGLPKVCRGWHLFGSAGAQSLARSLRRGANQTQAFSHLNDRSRAQVYLRRSGWTCPLENYLLRKEWNAAIGGQEFGAARNPDRGGRCRGSNL